MGPELLDLDGAPERRERLLARASVCSYCGVGCPYTVETDAKGIDRIHPLSSLGLCVKGRTSLDTGGDARRRARLEAKGLADDRIRHPMVRGHDGRMKRVSWAEALDRAAWLMLHAREWVGPEAVAIYGNGQKSMESIWLASLYKLVFRTATIGANSEHCLASAGAAHEQNFGNEASFTWQGFEELSGCDVAVLHGTNAFITFPQAYEKLARNRKARKVVIDPIRTDTVSELQALDPSTIHLAFKQGGDVAVNLAVARIILEEGWEDRAFLELAVDAESLAAFRSSCMQARFEVSAVAARFALEGQSPEALERAIRAYAELIARPGEDGHRPRVAFVSSMGINQSTGAFGFSSNLNLLLLTGNVGREGAGSLRIAGQSNATSELMLGFNGRRLIFNLDPSDPEHRSRVAEALELPELNIPTAAGTPVAHMADDDRIYCFLFIGTQMTKNMPRLGHWKRRMGRAFNVVIDPFLAEGALEHADVLLPSLTYTERYGVIQRGDRSLQLQQPQTEPPEEAWSDEKILVELALAMGRRLEDPDTAQLNQVEASSVQRVFGRYRDRDGAVSTSQIFDHLVQVSRQLDVYCKLEDESGAPITHEALRQAAGRGIQWQGDGRYREARREGAVFPVVRGGALRRARLVMPPDPFLERLDAPLPEGCVGLVSGRGRPGWRARYMRGRYNSGIKTRPLTGDAETEHQLELNPETRAALGLASGDAVRISARHGVCFARAGDNPRVPPELAYVDFVPGEVNRLTDYVDADRFTNQSFIKRTPVRIRGLLPLEQRLWEGVDPGALEETLLRLERDYRACFSDDAMWLETQRSSDPKVWLPAEQLEAPGDPVAEAAGALSAFLQRMGVDAGYRERASEVLAELRPASRRSLLLVLLPFLRRFDDQASLHRVLSAVVGPVRLRIEDGTVRSLDLLSAHASAVLEFKEEIVAIQLFVAVKRGLEVLFGPDAIVEQSRLAFVSGVAIPCAGDVPAHFLGISPAELGSEGLVHSRVIGSSALIVVDKATQRAVRVDVTTGVLPKDRELTKLRGLVINRKRGCSTFEHRRFFDRLGELICDYVRSGDANFEVHGPAPLDWDEYRRKLNYAPAKRPEFVHHLVRTRASPGLLSSLVQLGILDPPHAERVRAALELAEETVELPRSRLEGLEALPLRERVDRVVAEIIAPVLENDGGKLELLELDEARGHLEIRFVGSCANCPYSLLSMEQLVRPTLLGVPGIQSVRHRARARSSELRASEPRDATGAPPRLRVLT